MPRSAVSTRTSPIFGVQVDAGRADLVLQSNAVAGRRGAFAEEHNRLVADVNGLIDALNWARW